MRHAFWSATPVLGLLMAAGVAAAPEAGARQRAVAVLRVGLSGTGADAFWPAMHAAEGLTAAGFPAEVRAALQPRLATEEDPRHRCGLARELVRAGDRGKLAILAGVLAGEDALGHVHAAESLFKVGEIGDAAAMERAARQRNDIKLWLMASAALARAGNAAELAAIRAALRGDDADGIMLAGWILGQAGDATDIEPLRARLDDAATPLARAYLEHALAMRGDAAGLEALGRNLAAADDTIRAAAANAAGEARAAAFAQQLVRLLEDPVPDVRIRAAHALVAFDHPDGPPRASPGPEKPRSGPPDTTR
ncbi:MAG: HEAT repeat domain-containing protein [Planctomycetia bacterium]